MIREQQILSEEALIPVPRERIEFWGQSKGDRFLDEHFRSYYPVYAELAARYYDSRILEIGVRFGYTAFAMCWGAGLNSGWYPELYLGLDNESYFPGSNDEARRFLEIEFPGLPLRIEHWDTADGLPMTAGVFDLIHVDGNHSYEGALRDLRLVWSVLNPKGTIIVDDTVDPEVNRAIQLFLEERTQDPSCEGYYQFLESVRGLCLIWRGEVIHGDRNRTIQP